MTLMEQSTPANAAQVETDDRRRATVVRIDAKHLFVSLSSASERGFYKSSPRFLVVLKSM